MGELEDAAREFAATMGEVGFDWSSVDDLSIMRLVKSLPPEKVEVFVEELRKSLDGYEDVQKVVRTILGVVELLAEVGLRLVPMVV